MEMLAPTQSRTHATHFFTSCEAHFKVCCDIHKRKKATETAEQLLPNVTDQKGEIGRRGDSTRPFLLSRVKKYITVIINSHDDLEALVKAHEKQYP